MYCPYKDSCEKHKQESAICKCYYEFCDIYKKLNTSIEDTKRKESPLEEKLNNTDTSLLIK